MGQNGTPVIRIGKKGIRRFVIGEDSEINSENTRGKVFEVDVVKAFNAWSELQNDFLDENRNVAHVAAWSDAKRTFTEGICGHPVSEAEAAHFVAALAVEVNDLQDFFTVERLKKSSSAEKPGETASASTLSQREFSGGPSAPQEPGKYATILEELPGN